MVGNVLHDVLWRLRFNSDFQNDTVIFDVSLTLVQDVSPRHETRISPVVLLGRIIVVGLPSEVGNAVLLRNEPEFRLGLTGPRP